MPKYRKLHVKILESFDFNDMPDDFHRLFWTLLPLVTSREGTLPAHPTLILSKVFPMRRDVESEQIEAALAWFSERDMIRYYEADGRRYLWIVNFGHYQGITDKEAPSNYPPPPTDFAPGLDQVQSSAGVEQEQVSRKSASYSYSYSDSDADADADARETIGDGKAAPKQEPELVRNVGAVFKAWELARGGLMNQLDADQIGELVDQYGQEWAIAAIHEANASRNGKIISLNFVKAILARWGQEGFKSVKGGTGPPGSQAAAAVGKRDVAEQMRKQLRAEGIAPERIETAIRQELGEGY